MTTPTANLPAQPEIPASNASYAKVSDRMFKAAQAGNPAAVQYVVDTVKGTNTYCRMLRRYGASLIEALKAPEPVVGMKKAGKAAPKKPAKKAPKKVAA